MYKVSFWGHEDVRKLDSSDGSITLNIFKTTELYTLKGWILCYVKYISQSCNKRIKTWKKCYTDLDNQRNQEKVREIYARP